MILNSVRTIALAVVASTLALSSLSKAADFKVNGFGSAYYGQALNRELLPYNLSNTNPDFTHFSLIGADLAVKFNDQWTVAAELIAQGQNGPQNNYTAYAEWAYVNWAPIPGMSVKVGRQRNPIWSASEYINSHYQLPYRVMPQVVYSLSPFAAFDGASVTQTLEVGEGMKASFQVFGGTALLATPISPSVATFNGDRLVGARANLEGDGWRIRAQASTAKETINWQSPYTFVFGALNAATVKTLTTGYRYDKNNFVSWGEFGYLFSDNGTPVGTKKFVRKGKAGYVLAGYRLEKFMPRYTYSRGSFDELVVSGKVTSHTFGLNYQANENVTVKADYEITTVPTAGDGPVSILTQPASATAKSGSAFYLGADFYF